MKNESFEFLKKLVKAISPSGYEAEAAVVWRAEARKHADAVRHDLHGNSYAMLNRGGKPRVMLAGHYDEIGFLISHIDSNGFLWIVPVGGWDPQIPQGQRVVIKGRKGHVPGVIGKCPVHLLKEDARRKVLEITDLWVDIGVKNKAAAEKLVAVGDPLVLDHDLQMLQGETAVARGFDDRVGAFVVLEALRLMSLSSIKAEVHAVATAQEEIGLRGARTSAYGVDPDIGIVVDVTFATDHPSMGDVVRREGTVEIGKGPVIARGANINARLFDLLVETAKKWNIPYQIVAEPSATGTDANAIQLSRSGVATALVSVPNRYMHSSCELVSLNDVDNCARLLAHAVRMITTKTDLMPF